jgi:hypothetical protein
VKNNLGSLRVWAFCLLVIALLVVGLVYVAESDQPHKKFTGVYETMMRCRNDESDKACDIDGVARAVCDAHDDAKKVAVTVIWEEPKPYPSGAALQEVSRQTYTVGC